MKEGLDGGSGIHYSFKNLPIIHLIKIFGLIIKVRLSIQQILIIHYSYFFSNIH